MGALRLLLLFAGVALMLGPVAGSADARGFKLGYFDPRFTGPADERAFWLDTATRQGARLVRLQVSWAQVAARRPADAVDPADPAYRWELIDGAVRDATARRLTVLLTLNRAPAWAEGRDRPAGALAGTWRPGPGEFGAFATAAARRYSGTFQPPGADAALPRVRYWQAWNEPNLDAYLTPQWVKRNGKWRSESPGVYRALLNAFADGVKRALPDNQVVTAGTAPFGDLPGGRRVRPVRFLRDVLCLGRSLRPHRCPATARFDALSHHPYGVGAPRRHALDAEDAAVPDVDRLVRVLRAAERRRTVAGPRRHPVWVTEISWDSSPPDPDGVPEARHARWLSEGLYELWRDGVSVVTWLRVGDELPVPSFPSTNQSGTHLTSGEPKLAAAAYAFPFVVRPDGRSTRLWGKAPAAGPVVIERRAGPHWRRIERLQPDTSGVFAVRVRTPRRHTIRARQGTNVSLARRG